MDPRVKTIIKDLKSKSPSIRQDAARELGKLQVEDAVKPLIKMANGVRGIFKKYNDEDQLAAVEALAETGSERALQFLHYLTTPSIGKEEKGTVVDGGRMEEATFSVEYEYIYARGALKKKLSHSISYDWGAKPCVEDERKNETVVKIETALNRIKETVAEKEKNTDHKDIENKETNTQKLMKRINDACLSSKQAACCIGYLAWDLGCASLIPITTLGLAVMGTAVGAAPGMVAFNSLQVSLGNSVAAGAYILGSGIAMSVGACAGMFLGVRWGYSAGISIADWLYEHNPFENALG
jgi:hypothetical protein